MEQNVNGPDTGAKLYINMFTRLSQKRCLLSTFLTYHLSKTIFWLSMCTFKTRTLTNLWRAFRNGSLLVEQESKVDMCRYLDVRGLEMEQFIVLTSVFFTLLLLPQNKWLCHFSKQEKESSLERKSGQLVHVSRGLSPWGNQLTLRWS